MVAATQSRKYSNILGGIVFSNKIGKGSSNITYKIRLSSRPRNAGGKHPFSNPFSKDSRWYTEFEFPFFQRVGPREKGDPCGGTPGTSD